MKKTLDGLAIFLDCHPAFLSGLFFLLGLSFIKAPSVFLVIPLVLLILTRRKKKLHLIPLLTLFFLALFYGNLTQEKGPNQLIGTALFAPSEIKLYKSHFKKSYFIKGKIIQMQDCACNISCQIPLPGSLRPLKASQYLIKGSLEKTEEKYTFTPDPQENWVALKPSFSFPEWRFKTKEALSQKIHGLYKNTKVANFLTALTLGDLNDPLLRFSFGRLGLQHILAISGFHFGLLTLFLNFFLKRILPTKYSLLTLLVSLSFYFFLIGYSPSILRAYLAITFYLIGKLNNLRTSPLNIFGVVLLLELLIAPESLTNLGFQLSFLATGSILFLFPLTFSWVEKLLPLRSIPESLALKLPDRCIYLFCAFLRSTFALNLAVHMTVIPVCLSCFGKFPLISLAYNLFIPLCVSFVLFLFLLSIPLFFLIPYTECLADKVLDLILEAPNRFNYCLYCSLPLPLVIILLSFLLLLPFFLKTPYKNLSATTTMSSLKEN